MERSSTLENVVLLFSQLYQQNPAVMFVCVNIADVRQLRDTMSQSRLFQTAIVGHCVQGQRVRLFLVDSRACLTRHQKMTGYSRISAMYKYRYPVTVSSVHFK